MLVVLEEGREGERKRERGRERRGEERRGREREKQALKYNSKGAIFAGRTASIM